MYALVNWMWNCLSGFDKGKWDLSQEDTKMRSSCSLNRFEVDHNRKIWDDLGGGIS